MQASGHTESKYKIITEVAKRYRGIALASTRKKKRSVNQNTGRRVAEIRNFRNCSLEQLARATGIKKSTLQHYEHCRARISVDALLLLARELHCQSSDLTAQVGSPMPR